MKQSQSKEQEPSPAIYTYSIIQREISNEELQNLYLRLVERPSNDWLDQFLETGAGKFFKPARKLFKRCNFELCKPFAHYKEDINSIYLTKLINND